MKNAILAGEFLSDTTASDVASRDSVLWIGPGIDRSEAIWKLLARVVTLPWKYVYCESSDADFLEEVFAADKHDSRLTSLRGHIHVVASDPRDQSFAPRSMQIFLLNGRSDAQGGTRAARRLNGYPSPMTLLSGN